MAETPAFAGTGQVNVSPVEQDATTGGSVTLTIEVQNVGQVKPFVPVVVQINPGPDSNGPQTLETDANGDISYTINNNGGSGTDALSASWVDAAGTTVTGVGTVTWQPPPPPPGPAIHASGPTDGSTYFFGQVPAVFYSCDNSSSCTAVDEDGNPAPSGQQLGASTGVNPGNYSITITAVGTNGQTTTQTISYAVIPLPQTITFHTSPPNPSLYGGTYGVNATGGGSGNPVVVSLTQGSGSVCTLSGGTITYVGVGTCQVTANQAGDIDWDAAPTVSQTITVQPAPLSITTSSSTSIYGSPIATVTPSYGGFVFGQSPSVLSPSLTCVSGASQSSDVGTYTNVCSGAQDPNYAISYTNGTQTINPAPLTITASSSTIFYGQAIPAVTPIYSGFVLGQTASVLNPAPTCVVPATIASDAGTYTTFCAGAMDKNYTFTYVNGTLLIKPAPTTLVSTPAVISLLPLFPYLFTLNTQLTSQITLKGLPNQTVNFAIKGGGALCTGMTNGNGIASCNALCTAPGLLAIVSAQAPGLGLLSLTCQLLLSLPGVLGIVLHDGYTVSFAGTHNYLPSTTSAQLIEVLPGLTL